MLISYFPHAYFLGMSYLCMSSHMQQYAPRVCVLWRYTLDWVQLFLIQLCTYLTSSITYYWPSRASNWSADRNCVKKKDKNYSQYIFYKKVIFFIVEFCQLFVLFLLHYFSQLCWPSVVMSHGLQFFSLFFFFQSFSLLFYLFLSMFLCFLIFRLCQVCSHHSGQRSLSVRYNLAEVKTTKMKNK